MAKILLNSEKSKYSVNENEHLGINLTQTGRLLPFNEVSDTLDLMAVYENEREDCDKYRMMFTINPLCSNVLFNTKTEVVRFEGSSACTIVFDNSEIDHSGAINNSPLNRRQAIKDTEYSHPEAFSGTPYVYHCGLDIFNNHLLRNRDFVHVGILSGNTSGANRGVYNTIEDFLRDCDGKNIKEDVNLGGITKQQSNLHIYNSDNISTMFKAYYDGLKEVNGWYGFNNLTTIDIPNAVVGDNEKICINKVMNNNKSCEMIDMYPDRSLYSFIPKVNKYRNRVEKNWDYCITYPKYKDWEMMNTLCGIPEGTTPLDGGAAVKVISATKTYGNGRNTYVIFKTMLRHTLSANDTVRLFYMDGDEYKRVNRVISIRAVGLSDGSEKNRYFSVSYDDIASLFDFNSNDELIKKNSGSETPVQFFFKKTEYGLDCEYFFRKFVKLTKKKNEEDVDLDSVINKLAYAENIYGDRVAQVVYTDDIDVSGLVDYKREPLTELYFTVIKRNVGHDLWYGCTSASTDSAETICSEDVEFSHCFGKVTSGLDIPADEYDYNVRKLHNIDFDELTQKTGIDSSLLYGDIVEHAETIDDDITSDSYLDGVYGDIVEFSPYMQETVVIETVLHRFNTEQRETTNDEYRDVFTDELRNDDFDMDHDFKVAEKTINEITIDNNDDKRKIFANINPEGYYYNPYTRIKIKDISDNIDTVTARVIKIVSAQTNYQTDVFGNTGITITTVMDYKMVANDSLCFYNNETKECCWGNIFKVNGNIVTLLIDFDYNEDNATQFTILKTTDAVPLYATYLPTIQSFRWREIVPMYDLKNDSELFSMPFVNGRHYIHNNVNFFLRRQDPDGEFGLLEFDKNATYKSPLGIYRVRGWQPIDWSWFRYKFGDITPICY